MKSIQKSNNQNTEFFFQKNKTLDGFNFDPNLNVWKFTDASNSKQFIFSKLNIQEDKMYGIKKTFIWYLENYSVNHASGFLQKWYEMGYSGLSKEAYDYLKDKRVPLF